MNITVLGTSNSLMRHGYVLALRNHPDVASVYNLSLGASSALAFTVMTSEGDSISNRYCILEYAVNQHSFLRQGHQKVTIEDEITGCVATVSQRSGIPVFLLLPRQKCDASSSRIRTLYLALAEDLGVPVFDGIAWTDTFSCVNQLDRFTLFKDDGHLAPWVATALAVDLVAFLRCIEVNSASSRAIVTDTRHYCAASLPPDANDITRGNSLFSQRFLALQANREALIRIPNDMEVCGIGLNIPMSSVVIEFTGDSEALQLDFRNGFARRNGSSFIHVVVSFPKNIVPLEGFVKMRILTDDEIDHDAFRMFPSIKAVRAAKTAEISTLVCASRGKTATTLTPYKVRTEVNCNPNAASVTAQLMRLLYAAGGRLEDAAALDV